MSNPTPQTLASLTPVERLQHLQEAVHAARAEIGKVIYGQDEAITQTLITLFAGGHALLVGVPGLAKTLLVQTIGQTMGLNTGRIQCTPDLMPADILGAEVLEEDTHKHKHFRFIKGPIFCSLLMADEINRASPRTQSALLQAMAEKAVTTAGQTHDLPTPFHVLATQNPLEHEGTYPLPEAQLDRFMMQINVPYPSLEDEKHILIHTTSPQNTQIKQIFSPTTLKQAQDLVRTLPVGEEVVNHILTLIRSTRPEEAAQTKSSIAQHLLWGAGPRAGQALLLCAKAKAATEGRFSPSIEDVNTLTPAILRHRVMPSFSAKAAGHTVESLVNTLCGQ